MLFTNGALLALSNTRVIHAPSSILQLHTYDASMTYQLVGRGIVSPQSSHSQSFLKENKSYEAAGAVEDI